MALSGDRVVINNYIYPEGGLEPIEWLDAFFPIGCLQLTFDNNNPQTRITGTTWDRVAEGRFLVGVGDLYQDKNGTTYGFAPGDPTATGDGVDASTLRKDGNEAGEYRVTLVTDDMPSHQHETNINGVNVQVDSPVGTGPIFEQIGAKPGTLESSDQFKDEQRDRNLLAAAVGWNFNGEYGFAPNQRIYPTTERYLTFLRALDLNFLNGTAANFSETRRNQYKNSQVPGAEGIVWKEMVGLWNGETRFIPEFCNRTNFSTARPDYPEIDRAVGPVAWCLEHGAQFADDAASELFLLANQQLPAGVRGVNQAILQQTDNVAFRTSTAVGLGSGHNNIPPSYGVYVWKRTS